MGLSKSSAKGKLTSRNKKKNQINNLTLHLKQLEKEEKKNTRVSRRKEIIKVREEINEKETKETTANINKAKSWFFEKINKIRSDQIRSVTQSCPTLCDPMHHSTPGLHVHHRLPEFTETHVHRVRDAIQPSHSLPSPSPPAPNPSQHQSLFQ